MTTPTAAEASPPQRIVELVTALISAYVPPGEVLGPSFDRRRRPADNLFPGRFLPPDWFVFLDPGGPSAWEPAVLLRLPDGRWTCVIRDSVEQENSAETVLGLIRWRTKGLLIGAGLISPADADAVSAEVSLRLKGIDRAHLQRQYDQMVNEGRLDELRRDAERQARRVKDEIELYEMVKAVLDKAGG